MADDILRRIQRLRELEERRSRLALMEAQREEDEAKEALDSASDAIDASRELTPPQSPGRLAHHHAFAAAAEETRRDALQGWHRCTGEVEVARVDLVDKSVQAEVMRGVADARDAERRADKARAEQAELDETGTRLWMRRTA